MGLRLSSRLKAARDAQGRRTYTYRHLGAAGVALLYGVPLSIGGVLALWHERTDVGLFALIVFSIMAVGGLALIRRRK